MICRGSEFDNLLLVLLLVLVAHQTKFQQICFNEIVLLVVVGDTWTSRARQRSMKTVRHGKIPVQSNWACLLVASKSFQHQECTRRIAAQSPRARWDFRFKGQVPARLRLAGVVRTDTIQVRNQGSRWNSNARLQQRASPTSKCKGKGACGDGRDWLAMVISSACDHNGGGLQLLRLPGNLAENGMAAGIMLHCYGAPVMVRRRRRPCSRVVSGSTGHPRIGSNGDKVQLRHIVLYWLE